MLKHFRILLLIYAITVLCACKQKAAPIPVIDFFRTPEKVSYRISPDGKYISYLKPYKDKQNLFIQSLEDGKERMATSFTDYSIRGDYFWTYNNEIVFFQDIITVDEIRMFALDVSTLKTQVIISPKKVRIAMIGRDKHEPDVVTIRMNKRDSANFDIYKLNIKTKELNPYLVNPGNITQWFPDADGKIRLVRASDGVDETILYRPNDKAPFKPIIANNFKTSVKPIAFTGVGNYFLALSNVNRDKSALVEINAEDGKEHKVIFASNNADIQDYQYSKNKHKIELVTWDAAKPQKHFLDPEIKLIYDKLSTELKGNEINIADRDSAENKFIIITYTDRNPGSYYLYEKNIGKLTKLGDINPDLKPDELCTMQPISYKASDGMTINGYLTLPLGSATTNLPLVVMPHDGPFGHNGWGYNPEVQFLANRGYAVFLVNYRGSTGFGKAFYSAGFKEVGGKIQQDITDGVNWLIQNKTANPKKIAIFGGGFGGFSALYGVSFHPDMYNCAIVQHGLINFFTYIKDAPPFLKPLVQMTYERVGNPETDANQLRAISPVFNISKIRVPLLIFQGARDDRANISELNQFVRELQKQNGNDKVKYFLKPRERTFFRSQTNRMEMYAEIEKFLDENMRVKP
ncbi:alpha/beta hydrolase family protein [Mucilaginibacter sp. OK098]|uniref:alpha/beta hydrolase family protein n=1 Tax=Mucilaginibacter sp. OK098 TaxID=1855297 RepID=UPI000920560F|nr:prolyl oligopeptidase family serine peptidase [Mucilaginibacter sp. OK098]SHN20013.1 Dipeptidyl aminopeptidase/acylaminoacyl peptidase [Mucilaginibacter sp. OK098]